MLKLALLLCAGALVRGLHITELSKRSALALSEREAPTERSRRSCLPLLQKGTQGGLSAAATTQDAPVLAPLLQRAYDAPIFGSPGIYVQGFNWADVEPKPQEYALEEVRSTLSWLKSFPARLVTYVANIDTERVSVPSDLANPADPTRLRPGLQWNDTLVIDRYAAMLSKVIPVLLEFEPVHIGFGNEVDVNLLANPTTAEAWAQLTFVARAFARNLTSKLEDTSLGFTFTFSGLKQYRSDGLLKSFLELADAIPITYYPLVGANAVVEDPLVAVRDFADIEESMPLERCILMQEVGYPSGFNNKSSVDSSSYHKQADFFRYAVKGIRLANATREGPHRSPRFRAVSFSNLADFPVSVCDYLNQYYNSSAPGFREYLCTLGMAFANGTTKEAYTAFLEVLG